MLASDRHPVAQMQKRACSVSSRLVVRVQRFSAASKVIVSTAVSKTMELRRSCLSATCEA